MFKKKKKATIEQNCWFYTYMATAPRSLCQPHLLFFSFLLPLRCLLRLLLLAFSDLDKAGGE